MKTTALAIALLMGGAAFAQTSTTTTTTVQPDVDADVGVQPDGDLDIDADVDLDTETTTTTHSTMDHSAHGQTGIQTSVGTNTMAAANWTTGPGPVVQPGNMNPEHDARGIAVISAPAVVPAGWNGSAGTGVGGPLVDPATGTTLDAADESYPACTASVTDNCVQAYEVGRR